MKNDEYWFTFSDRWLKIAEEHVARRLIHISAKYDFDDVKRCQGYVAFGCRGKLLVMDTSGVCMNLE